MCFKQPELTYRRYRIYKDGIFPLPEKGVFIKNAKSPKNATELKSYLGLTNYYHRHLPNLSTIVEPSRKLFRKHEKWTWRGENKHSNNRNLWLIHRIF